MENPVIDNQIMFIEQHNEIETLKFPIPKGGLRGYIKSYANLKNLVKTKKPDLIHAHYSFSGFLAYLSSGRIPVICSLMGSDLLQKRGFILWLTNFFSKHLWKKTIVKSKEMNRILKNSYLIPNGVDFENFKPIEKSVAIKETNFKQNVFNIIFVALDPEAAVKNINLAKESVSQLNIKSELHIISNISYPKIPFYYSAADVLLLTSLTEGSPNVIKEAMACNCPIVSTKVGDVEQIINNTLNCYTCGHSSKEIAQKLEIINQSKDRTNGRENIQHLSSLEIRKKIINVYKSVI